LTGGPEEIVSASACAVLSIVFVCGFISAQDAHADSMRSAHAHRTALETAARIIAASWDGVRPEDVCSLSLGSAAGGLRVRIAEICGNASTEFGPPGSGEPDARVTVPGVIVRDGKPVPVLIGVEVWS